MTVKPKVLVLTVLLGVLILPSLAAAAAHPAADSHGRPGGGEHGSPGAGVVTDARFLTHYLNLTSTQVTQLQTLLQTLRTAEQAAHDATAPLCQQLRTDVTATAPDPTTVGKDYLALVDSREQIQAAIKAFETSFEAILTTDQLTRFQALVQGAASGDASDALPGCPPASTTTSS